jgi:hypothetical protein
MSDQPAYCDRFDYSTAFRAAVDKAIELDICDALEFVALGARFGKDERAILNQILNYAYAARHCEPEKHREFCPLYDAHYVAMQEAA